MFTKIKVTLKREIMSCYEIILYFVNPYTKSGKRAKNELKKYFNTIGEDEKKTIEKSFTQFSKMQPKAFVEFIKSYKKKLIIVKKDAILTQPLKQNEPIVICNVRDDLSRVKMQLKYYRMHGIRHFCYIDNLSIDGTFDYLINQDDVTLFSINEKYTSPVSMSWKRQVMDYIGYDKWYLCIDSDELYSYYNIEQKPFPIFINYLIKNNIKTVCSFLLDMHQNAILFSGDEDDIVDKFRYFKDSYKLKRSFFAIKVIHNIEMENNSFVTKTLHKVPLARISKDMLFHNHIFLPFKFNFETKVISALLHYKFIASDASRYIRIVKEANYASGSSKYKRFLNGYKNQTLSFFTKESIEFEDSKSLFKIKIFHKKFYEDFR